MCVLINLKHGMKIVIYVGTDKIGGNVFSVVIRHFKKHKTLPLYSPFTHVIVNLDSYV